jgi:hypothetical protein
MAHRSFVFAGCTLLAASGAHAAFFSFASDNDHTSWTFRGIGNNVRDAQDGVDPQVLLIDDNNGVLPPLAMNLDFNADFIIGYLASVPLGGGTFVHNYSLNGNFSFVDAGGNAVLTCLVRDGSLTAIGGAASWFSTATLQGNDNPFGAVTYTWNGPANPAYGLFPGQSIGPDDAAFTLTVLNSPGVGVPLDQGHLPSQQWFSEGSYSGSAFFVPAPGAAALLGLGGLVVARRRRG